MKFRIHSLLLAFCFTLAACGNQGAPAATVPLTPSVIASVVPTATPDPCSPENLEQSIKQVNDLMREFNDAFRLASNVAKEHVPPIISDMQRIRRAAEDQKVPVCLSKLKAHQLAHMNTVINTMLGFVSGANTTALGEGLTRAQAEYELYTKEMAGLLGLQPTATVTP